jgi:hypothetical protein
MMRRLGKLLGPGAWGRPRQRFVYSVVMPRGFFSCLKKDLASYDAAIREIPCPIPESINDPNLIAFIIFALFLSPTSDLCLFDLWPFPPSSAIRHLSSGLLTDRRGHASPTPAPECQALLFSTVEVSCCTNACFRGNGS